MIRPTKAVFVNTSDIKYIALIISIFVAACIETDIYLPAFPDMMAYFHATEESIQNILTWNFFGICLSGPFYGPISDSFGRKKPLLVALGLFLLGSMLTVYADSFTVMLFGRLLQGLGSGGCFTLGTAVIFDAFQGEKAISMLSKLNFIMPFIMATAPLVGGWLNQAYGFRSNFLAIAGFVLLSLIICLFCFAETHPKEKRTPFALTKVLSSFKEVFSCLPFWQLTAMCCLVFGAFLAFLSTTSLLFVLELGVSKGAFPYFQGALLAAWVVGNLTCAPAIRTWGLGQVKMGGAILVGFGGISLLAAGWLTPDNPYALTAPMVIFTFGANWMVGLYFPESMELLPHIKGVTASLLTSARLLTAALVVALAGYLYDGTIYPIASIVFAVVAVILPLMVHYERGKRPLPLSDKL